MFHFSLALCQTNDNIQFSFSSDVNECDKTAMCSNGRCVNMMGKFKCVCNPGYVENKDMTACIGKLKLLSWRFIDRKGLYYLLKGN